ncbi:MAG: hypothetical protein F6J98_18090 [Moorea sp. SIO4G2]|nr:hypothetical protein [Moorena sp. SIO4G2]
MIILFPVPCSLFPVPFGIYSVSRSYEVHIIFYLFPLPSSLFPLSCSLLPAPKSLKTRNLYLMGIRLAIFLYSLP